MVDGYYLRECVVSIPLVYGVFDINFRGSMMKYVLSLSVSVFTLLIIATIVLFANEAVKTVLASIILFSMFTYLIHTVIWGLE